MQAAGGLGDADVLGAADEYRDPSARKERGPQDDRVVGLYAAFAASHFGRLCRNSASTRLNFSGSSTNKAWPSPSNRSRRKLSPSFALRKSALCCESGWKANSTGEFIRAKD